MNHTTCPFPAVLHRDRSLAQTTAQQDVPGPSFAVGHAADVVPAIPWPSRKSAILRNHEIQRTVHTVRNAEFLYADRAVLFQFIGPHGGEVPGVLGRA
jgi:hypothetical protein